MEPDREQAPAPDSERVAVWDPFVRLFHWTVVAGFFIAYFTEDELLTLHAWAGYAIGALLPLRLLWGFVGPRHARFSDFVCGPVAAWRYALDLVGFRAKRHIGHSPAGGVMVLVLLIGLLATVWSGLELHALENQAGPLAGSSATAGAAARRLPARDAHAREADEGSNDDRGRDRDRATGALEVDFWEDLHELLANLMLALVFLHVGGVVLASVVHRENLVAAMITGWKRAA